ncbi:MAG: hypothetical protein P4L33_02225 [Capsulimonadaceae bacterium]|nr:hypothetical protein [Capsulimonadaceae bacterium]
MKRIALSVAILALAAPTWAQIFHPIALAPETVGSSTGTTAKKAHLPIAITLQGEYFHFNQPPGSVIEGQQVATYIPSGDIGTGYIPVSADYNQTSPDQISGLIAADVPLTTKLTIGGWYASDVQKMKFGWNDWYYKAQTQTKLKSQWAEGHASYALYNSQDTTFGVMAGYLKDWNKTDNATSSNGAKYTGGSFPYQWAELAGFGSIGVGKANAYGIRPTIGVTLGRALKADSKTANATTFGASFSYPCGKSWSVDASAWQLAPDNTNNYGVSVLRVGLGVGYKL